MAKKYKRGNSVTQSVGYCQFLIGKIVAMRDDDCVVSGKVIGIHFYVSTKGLQSVKIHLAGAYGYFRLDDLVCVYP